MFQALSLWYRDAHPPSALSLVSFVQILAGECSNITLAPPDATSASDLGKIEYRRDPLFWVDAVAKMVGS